MLEKVWRRRAGSDTATSTSTPATGPAAPPTATPSDTPSDTPADTPADTAADPPATALVDRAADLPWTDSTPGPGFLAMVTEAVEEARGRRGTTHLVVIGGDDVEPWSAILEAQWPDCRVHRVRHDSDVSEAHVRLASNGPVDLVVDAADTSAHDQVALFERVFMHLRARGVYLARRVVRSDEEHPRDLWDVVSAAHATRIHDYRDHLDRGVGFRDVVGLATVLRQVDARGRALRIVTGSQVFAKVREEEVDAVLAARPRLGRTLDALPPTSWEAGVDYRSTRDDSGQVRAVFRVPELTLRRFDGPTCSRGQIVTQRNLLLPATYRHFWRERMINVYVVEKAPLFGGVRRRLADAEPLPGAYFHFDCEWPGHFGHLLTDQVSRLWAWERVRELDPEVKLLTTLQPTRDPYELAPFETQILSAFGIGPDDVQLFDKPCRPERLYTATGMFSLPEYAHPDMAAIWDRIGDHLAAGAEQRPRAKRVFVSRHPSLKRSCNNTPEVEEAFRRHGFEVLYPEEHPLAEQVAIFRAAEVVAGFAGSGMFSMALTSRPARVLTLAPHSYTARNEFVLAAVRGHQLTTIWSEPDVPHPQGRWTKEAFASSFTFDFDKEGSDLSTWFAGL